MQNLLETYAESSNSSHISIESDKQPVSVDVDETSTVQEHQDTRKQPPKTFKPQEQIFKFFTPVQKQVPASSEQLHSLPNNPSENQEAPASGLTGEESREGEKMPNAKRNFEPSKKALTQKHGKEKQ